MVFVHDEHDMPLTWMVTVSRGKVVEGERGMLTSVVGELVSSEDEVEDVASSVVCEGFKESL